ncbi:uncharacterized protein EV154DRAFT_462599 [Mucor mucedo]|uniref:uncharacterized protein n=1 Tax=Mucor mucedo TaxID=29922 RepID=UPI002221287F|nr:uncharacterized protein EV154DRAFT_462599 [Mucor mucedo]KAI7892341.1 hypothetical protein EV154DRAFT_462599 [Mucor mucedo]
MPLISLLKEKFATAPIQDRESVVSNLASANTEDAKYYKGLIILQKLYDEVMIQEEPSKVREGTDTEIALLNEMQSHLNTITIRDKRFRELNTRFHLLIYPFEATKTIEFIKNGLRLDLVTQKQEQQQAKKEDLPVKATKSVLDNNLIDGKNLLRESIENFKCNGDIDIDVLAFPVIKDIMAEQDPMAADTEIALLKNLFMHPTEDIFGNDILDRLVRLWKLQNTENYQKANEWELENLPFNNFTLSQLNFLIECASDIVLLVPNFVQAYIEKLIPVQYYSKYSCGESITYWDDDENILHQYLCHLEEFSQKLSDIYFYFKTAVKFYLLRVDIIRNDFKETSLIQFLTGASTKAIVASPIPSRLQNSFISNKTYGDSSSNNEAPNVQLDIPLLSYHDITEEDKLLVIKEYLMGLITQEKLTVSIESLGAYMDYHNVLKPLYLELMLKLSPKTQDSWSIALGAEKYENLVTESFVSFAPSTLNASIKRKPEDTINLVVRTKNVQHISIRVFQINMENYSRLHMDGTEKTIADKNNNIDLDGLCPTWEKDIYLNSGPAIRVKTSNFVFGEEGFGPNVFKGRGLWVIEFVGNKNQCRAIIQKGYLRHVIQESTAGHVVKILDERGGSIVNPKIWCGNQYYQADQFNNIVIPYLASEDDIKAKKILLISESDEFCEPVSFYHLAEKYQLNADFYVNPEMISFNKKATVVVNPRLTVNGVSAPLSLLEDTSLCVECTNVDGVKNSTSYQMFNQTSDSIYFTFMVPERLTTLNFILSTKIKSLNNQAQSMNVQHNITYSTPLNKSGVPASVHLKKEIDDNYFIYAFGTNGEPKNDYEISIKLKHAFIQYRQVEVTLKSNAEGYVNLGKLANIQWIEYSNTQGAYKQWTINNDKQGLLPPAICVSADTPFNVAFLTASTSDSLYSLYKIGVRETLVENMSAFIKRNDNHISISKLPEGEYMLYLGSNVEGRKQIKCSVIFSQIDFNANNTASNENNINDYVWRNWIIGKNTYAKQNGIVLQKALKISDIHADDDNKTVIIQLQNWSSKAFVVVTTSTFVPTSSECLTVLMNNRSLERPFVHDNNVTSRSLFLNDKQLGEEYQYVLNRARSEKWAGSNLTKPSLLMHPKKNASTVSTSRILESVITKSDNLAKFSFSKRKQGVHFDGLRCGGNQTMFNSNESSLSFLNHSSPVLVLPIPNDGKITIARDALGFGGDFLQAIAISGDQVVSRTVVLSRMPDSPLFQYNDLRQKISSNKALIRSKVVKTLQPDEKLSISTDEFETIDSFEKLCDTIKNISFVSEFSKEYEFLQSWTKFDGEQKLKSYEERVCHELNIWLKHKDPIFFKDYVKPAIKCKVQKSFVDLYLIDGDLSEYSSDICKFEELSVAEKAILATTQSTEVLKTILRSFKESFDEKMVDTRSDTIFDSIISGSLLNISADAIDETSSSTYSVMPMSFACGSSPIPPSYSPTLASYSPSSPAYSPSSPEYSLNSFGSPSNLRARGNTALSGQMSERVLSAGQNEGPLDDNDEEFQAAAKELREKAKQLQSKVVYEFTEQTSEWIETDYYNRQDSITIKQFWIDYLEHHLHCREEQEKLFLTQNFVYCISNMTEIFYVLSLMDLPFRSEVNWTKKNTTSNEDKSSNNEIQISIEASPDHALMVFYRTLIESKMSFSSTSGNSDNNLMLGQELFVFDESTPIYSEECIKVNPLTTSLNSLIEYGSHVIISNASSKTLTCQVTVQIPTGAVPCKTTPYCKSKTISIDAYSTWHEVTGTFYFPSAGEFTIVPVTVSSLSGDRLLGKIEAIDVTVTAKNSDNVDNHDYTNQPQSLSSWSVLASAGSNASVVSFLEVYKKLDRIDFGLIEWRMKEKSFARQVFNVLSQQRHFFSAQLWKYGVYHQFDDIIRDLLHFNSSSLLSNVGQTFESPLICRKREDHTQVFDYYPLLNARAHPLNPSSHEILNKQFYKQYDTFLTYLSQQTNQPSNTDLIILTTYFILQDRIGDAQSTFSRIKFDGNSIDCQVQFDYINAYLKTRIPVTDQMELQIQDLNSVKEIASKYKTFGSLKWRKLFAELHEFVCEVEQGDSDIVVGSSQSTRRIQSKPVLEFEIDQRQQELVLQFANLKRIEINYYEMNIEAMFSTNPFMNDRMTSSLTSANFTWVKPSLTSQVDLPEKSAAATENNEDNDYNMIGVGQVNSVQTLNVPIPGGNKNVFVEISSVGTQSVIKRCQAYFSHKLYVHIAESFGIVRVLSGETKRPLAGVYVKTYARLKQNQKVHFWKDGYTGLNGVFDYISVTEGNALMGGSEANLKDLMYNEIDKLSILIMSADEGAVVKEVYPPLN